ncbi:protein BUNDLE SHEATH DEFECTIVE 2, chloroplastic [Mangifera indica]|uniref:protein BUNDLE SHEATH DEFECTIVE 2, chloroplastic n=1 Tax=Mangifera indica TaxID=29780 RepID=UPI001CFB247D|nr:protein BUNDLE SHEATH DEFECTIVE 2, chloroplastic [Mangifera indica]
MDSTLRLPSSIAFPISSSRLVHGNKRIDFSFGFQFITCHSTGRICASSSNGPLAPSSSNGAESSSVGNMKRQRSSLESLFCYDKPIPEERIEKPVGLSLSEKVIGNNLRCTDCQAKGAVLCTTCSGSGLYVDSILESQGIIVKVRCLGCGGTGNIMCTECGGRGHRGPK